MFTTYDWQLNEVRPPGEYTSSFVIPRRTLNDGDYFFSTALVTPGAKLFRHAQYDRLVSCKVVEAYEPERTVGTAHRGVLRPELSWTSQREAETRKPVGAA